MDNSELITELLQALTNDVDGLKKWAKQVPTTPAPDYRAKLDQMASAIEQLRQQSKTPAPAPAPIDTGAISAQLTRIEQATQQRPEYHMSQYVRYGAYSFGLMVIWLMVATGFALKWRTERNRYELSDWKWRHTSQTSPEYSTEINKSYSDTTATANMAWVLQQEQADATREAARQAAEQAATMNAEADQLEGKEKSSGKKGG